MVLGLALGCLAAGVIAATGPTLLSKRDALLGLSGGESAVAGAGVLAFWLQVATACAAMALAYREVR